MKKRMKKCLRRCLLGIVLMLSVISLKIIKSEAATLEPWDGASCEAFAEGSGTKEDPYQIENGAQLYNLAMQCISDTAYRDGYYVLTNDIDMNGKIFPGIAVFEGQIDGNGKTIFGFYQSIATDKYTGLICEGTGCKVKNLTIQGNIVNTGTYATGAFVGRMINGVLENCINECTITALNAERVGGIVGYAGSSGKILNCYNKANVKGKDNVAGICGNATGETSSDNYGKIILISQCCNLAEISGNDKVGGIVGYHCSSTVEKSFNIGKIAGTNYVGGIAGCGYAKYCTRWGTSSWYGTQYSYDRADTYVNDSFNAGVVSAEANCAGGIAGVYEYCTSYGGGGSAGHTSSKAYGGVYHCYNTGLVTSSEYAGGIVGSANMDVIDSYWLTNTCAGGTEKGTECAEELMLQAGCYDGFDFANNWCFQKNFEYKYPIVRGFDYPTITFCDYDGSILSQKEYFFGEKITLPSDPIRKADNIYTYEFAGWDKPIEDSRVDRVYNAVYTTTYIEYQVVFQDENGIIIEQYLLHYGDEVVPPVVSTDLDKKREFAGWDKTVTACEGDVTYTAVFNQWKYDGIGWWYRKADGIYPKNGWVLIRGDWYYFNALGYRLENCWVGNYYVKEDGTMATNQWVGSYYVGADGAYVSKAGWLKVDSKWYYLGADGARQTGWKFIGGTWYYLSGNGVMATGWQAIGGTWYYFNGSGAMVTGWQVIGGSWYYFNGSGAMVANQWVGNYYLQADGTMATNKWIGGYYVGANGAWVP